MHCMSFLKYDSTRGPPDMHAYEWDNVYTIICSLAKVLFPCSVAEVARGLASYPSSPIGVGEKEGLLHTVCACVKNVPN